MARWPSVVDEEFWSFAWQQSVHQHNHLLHRGKKLTNFEEFTLTDDPMDPKDYHTFGCPVYVLDPALADGNPVPKWSDRCYLGVYVGISPSHATTVAMVYNPKTKLTSPAYHCIFDIQFTTVSSAPSNNNSNIVRDVIASLLSTQGSWHHHDEYQSVPDPTNKETSPIDPLSVGRKYPEFNYAYATTIQQARKRKHKAFLAIKQAKARLHDARRHRRKTLDPNTSDYEGVASQSTMNVVSRPSKRPRLFMGTSEVINSAFLLVPSGSSAEDHCTPIPNNDGDDKPQSNSQSRVPKHLH